MACRDQGSLLTMRLISVLIECPRLYSRYEVSDYILLSCSNRVSLSAFPSTPSDQSPEKLQATFETSLQNLGKVKPQVYPHAPDPGIPFEDCPSGLSCSAHLFRSLPWLISITITVMYYARRESCKHSIGHCSDPICNLPSQRDLRSDCQTMPPGKLPRL